MTDKDKYAIMPTEATTVQSDLQIAEAKVSDVRDKDATLELIWKGSHRTLSDRGAHALLTHRGLQKSSVIIDVGKMLLDELSVAVSNSRCLRIGKHIATRLACVKEENHRVTLKDAREHTIRDYLVKESAEPISRPIMTILEALDRVRHVLSLKGAPPNAWPLRDVSVEFGIVKDGGDHNQPFQNPGEQVKEGQSIYFEIKNNGGKPVYVSFLDICLHHISLCESSLDIPVGKSQKIGNTAASTFKGLKVTWPEEVPKNQSIMATAVLVFTNRAVDLQHLETDVSSEGVMRNQKGPIVEGQEDDLMDRVGQIVRGDMPVSKVVEKAAGPKFGIWTYEYELVARN